MFLTFDEIVNDIVKNLDATDRAVLRETPERDLIMFHHSTGRHIRNHYKLWDKENPLTMKDYVPEIRDGVDYSPRHPDSVSTQIIKEVWKRVTAK